MCRRQWMLQNLHRSGVWAGALASDDADDDKRATTRTTPPRSTLPGVHNALLSPRPRPTETWEPSTARAIQLPLEPCGSTFCLSEYVVAGVPMRRLAVLDTGSPFLNAVPRAAGDASCLDDTDEVFAGSSGIVKWRRGDLSLSGTVVSRDNAAPRGGANGFNNDGSRSLGQKSPRRQSLDDETVKKASVVIRDVVYGLPDRSLRSAPHGGLFFGLAKRRADRIRPTLLEQLGSVKGISVSLSANSDSDDTNTSQDNKDSSSSSKGSALTLSRDRLIPATSDALRVVDLRKFGAPVEYFAARAAKIVANDRDATHKADGRPVVVIFDTGLTGIEVSDDLADALGPLRQLGVEFRSEQGRPFYVSASTRRNPRFVVTRLDLPWGKKDRLHVIALGLAFLAGKRLVVDVDDRRLRVDDLV